MIASIHNYIYNQMFNIQGIEATITTKYVCTQNPRRKKKGCTRRVWWTKSTELWESVCCRNVEKREISTNFHLTNSKYSYFITCKAGFFFLLPNVGRLMSRVLKWIPGSISITYEYICFKMHGLKWIGTWLHAQLVE